MLPPRCTESQWDRYDGVQVTVFGDVTSYWPCYRLGILQISKSNRCHIGHKGCWERDQFWTTVCFPTNFVTLFAVVWLDGEALFLGKNVYTKRCVSQRENGSCTAVWPLVPSKKCLYLHNKMLKPADLRYVGKLFLSDIEVPENCLYSWCYLIVSFTDLKYLYACCQISSQQTTLLQTSMDLQQLGQKMAGVIGSPGAQDSIVVFAVSVCLPLSLSVCLSLFLSLSVRLCFCPSLSVSLSASPSSLPLSAVAAGCLCRQC